MFFVSCCDCFARNKDSLREFWAAFLLFIKPAVMWWLGYIASLEQVVSAKGRGRGMSITLYLRNHRDEVQLGVERLLLGVIQVKQNYARYGNVTVFSVAKLKHSYFSGGHQGGDLGVVDIGLSPYLISSCVSVIETSRLPVLNQDRVDHTNA
jgi:hypothetical protein